MKSNIIAALSTFALSVSASGFSMTEGRLEDEQILINRPNIDHLLNYSELKAVEEQVVITMASTKCCASGTCDDITNWSNVPCTPENAMYIGACP